MSAYPIASSGCSLFCSKIMAAAAPPAAPSGQARHAARVFVSVASSRTAPTGYYAAPECRMSMGREALLSALSSGQFAPTLRRVRAASGHCKLWYMGAEKPKDGHEGVLIELDRTLNQVSELPTARRCLLLVDIRDGAYCGAGRASFPSGSQITTPSF